MAMIWYDAFTGKQTGLHNPNRHTVRCEDVLWAGVQCELGHDHPGTHRGTAKTRDGSGDSMPVEWEDER